MAESAEPSNPWDPHDAAFGETVLAINFVADAGRQMLESSTSVSEVLDRLRRLLPAVGLEGCSIDATLSSLTLSFWRPGQALPLTTMRELDISSPRLGLLSATDALLDRVESGATTLADAVVELRELVSAPPQHIRLTQLALLVSVVGWVLFLDGTTFMTVAVALATTALTFPIAHLVQRVRLPSTASVFLVAVLVAAVPNLLAAAGVSLRVGPAVVGALFIYLPGRAFVSSVIDGLANAPLSAFARGIEAVLAAGFLALGMLAGSRLGTGLGLNYEPDLTATPLWLSVVAAGVGVLGISVAWAMPRALVAPTVAISCVGWVTVGLVVRRGEGSGWWIYLIAAVAVAVLGTVAAEMQGSSASVYTGVAILPLVPGFALYTGMLAIAQSDSAGAAESLTDAGTVSLAIAIGVALGLSLSRNVIAVGRHVRDLSA